MDRLCDAFVIVIFLVLDAVQFIIVSHERGSHYSDFQSGRTVTEIEKPIPRIQMQGIILQGCLSMLLFFVYLGMEGVVDLDHNFKHKCINYVLLLRLVS